MNIGFGKVHTSHRSLPLSRVTRMCGHEPSLLDSDILVNFVAFPSRLVAVISQGEQPSYAWFRETIRTFQGTQVREGSWTPQVQRFQGDPVVHFAQSSMHCSYTYSLPPTAIYMLVTLLAKKNKTFHPSLPWYPISLLPDCFSDPDLCRSKFPQGTRWEREADGTLFQPLLSGRWGCGQHTKELVGIFLVLA